MKYFITSIGTRGDVEPFLAIGEILSKRGHHVAYAFSEQFADIIPEKAIFYPLSAEMIELINSKEGRLVMGKAGVFKKILALIVLHRKGQTINKKIAVEHRDAVKDYDPDTIIHNPKCSFPPLWSLMTKKENIIVSPVPYVMYPVKNHPHVGINRNLGNFLNRLTYKFSNFGLVKIIYDTQKQLDLKNKFSIKEIRKGMFSSKLVFSIDPQLFKRPDYWPNNVQILGYHKRNKIPNWMPDAEVVKFLDSHTKVLFLTFGSMFNSNPREISELFYNTLQELKIPCIINTGSGGLTPLKRFKNHTNFLFVEEIPYQWILKRVYAIVHHGGSGTTHMGLANGLPTLIIPHIIDQYGWNDLIHEQGVGPKGLSINNIEKTKLTQLIHALYTTKEFKNKAEELATRIKGNNFKNKLYEFLKS